MAAYWAGAEGCVEYVLEYVLWNLLRAHAEDGLLPAAILDFRGSIWQSLQRMPGKSLVAAAILDFRGSIWQSLQGLPAFWLCRCSDS